MAVAARVGLPRTGPVALAVISLQDEKSRLIKDETGDGRTLLNVRAHPTCKGAVAGADISMRFGIFASQYFTWR